ncbi:hypothetical protein N7516_010713 [Penicillium verrucosum]|uniref:uncharacterized protein n=1 Tax=Penicillium verrucosum TaxID=60171 RepID=UPI0025457618|nr:uncharacterized protein N7516_010713 [Penicillium verrucosum]KAJ5923010.1 hypothetical protein N7516_010713 [Penicillium verrucosum]
MASDHWAACACARIEQDSAEGERKRNQEAVNTKVEGGQQRGTAWQGSKEEQGRGDMRQIPIKSETGDIWRQTIETIPKDSLYRSCNKGGRSLAKFPAESPLGGVFVVKVAAGQVTCEGIKKADSIGLRIPAALLLKQ